MCAFFYCTPRLVEEELSMLKLDAEQRRQKTTNTFLNRL
jgi:hypothetical protein